MHSNNFCLYSLKKKKKVTWTNSFLCGNLLWFNSKVIFKSVCIYSATQIFVKYTGCWSHLKDKGYGGGGERKKKKKNSASAEHRTEWTSRKSTHLSEHDTFLLAETATFWGTAWETEQKRGWFISSFGSLFAWMSAESNSFNFSANFQQRKKEHFQEDPWTPLVSFSVALKKKHFYSLFISATATVFESLSHFQSNWTQGKYLR